MLHVFKIEKLRVWIWFPSRSLSGKKEEREVLNEVSVNTRSRRGINHVTGTVGADSQPVQGRHVLTEAVMGKLLQRGVHHGPAHTHRHIPCSDFIHRYYRKKKFSYRHRYYIRMFLLPKHYPMLKYRNIVLIYISTQHFAMFETDSQIFQRLEPNESLLRQEPQRVMVQHPGTKMQK